MEKHTFVTPEKALSIVENGQRIFIHGSAATPTALVRALSSRNGQLQDVEIVSISVFGDFPLALPEMQTSFRINSLFVSEPVRKAIHEGRGDYVPVFLSEIPELFRNGLLPIDIALVQVSPPDKNGFCSLGVSVDIARSAVNTAATVIAQVNPNMPRTLGDGMIHVSRFAAMTWCEDQLHEVMPAAPSSTASKIGHYIAELIDDGSTLQTGIGSIPDAVLSALKQHKDLGIHTEMFSDGIIDLMKSGVINNSRKRSHPGKSVTGFCIGTKKLYDFVNDNPALLACRLL